MSSSAAAFATAPTSERKGGVTASSKTSSSSSSSGSSKDAIYAFMKSENRPYSMNCIYERVGKQMGRTSVQKSLDALVAKNKVLEKTYGKQKVYAVIQSKSNDGSLQNEMRDLERECSRLTDELKIRETKLRAIEMELKKISAEPTTMEAETEKENLEISVQMLNAKVAKFSNHTVHIDPKEKKAIEDNHAKYVTGYRRRKKMCNEIIDAIMESYPKTKKHLLDEIGIETDEMVNFTLPAT